MPEPHPHWTGITRDDDQDWVEQDWLEEEPDDDMDGNGTNPEPERAPMRPSTLADDFFLSS
jgi:hypothetical protein